MRGMNIKRDIAQGVGAASTWALQHVFGRPAANFPGKVGLYIDPQLIGDLASCIHEGSVAVVGTNGKTTVTNLLADAFEAAGKSVVCNRTGANLDSGVATALMHTHGADWGVFESDELWLAKITPQLKPDYVVLLNLFRDQLDRVGEIDHIQESIALALASSPQTTLLYNADDPLCQAVADRVDNQVVGFGIGEDLDLAQNTVADSGMCQHCDAMLDYQWRQYGQLGAYHCPSCGFTRAEPAFVAHNVRFAADSTAFDMAGREPGVSVMVPLAGAYMAYNALAVHAAACLCGLAPSAVEAAIEAFDPHNGRLQSYDIDGFRILLNLAKNPTGFNQNLRIIEQDEGSAAVAFFINDKEADGHDVSWLWDIDFQELAAVDGLAVYAGGIRSHDMQVRLKYAGIDAQLVEDAEDFLARARAAVPDGSYYLIANYTALPEVKGELDRMEHLPAAQPVTLQRPLQGESELLEGESLVIVHMYPELLNLYGDGGNVTVLAERARRRGIDVSVVRVEHGQDANLDEADIVFLGGGPDREQRLASQSLLDRADDLRAYVEDDGVLLAICGGYQILGREWLLGDEVMDGLGIIGITTGRAQGGSHNRLVGNIVLQSPLAQAPIVGYENHAGRTFLDAGCKSFGWVIGHHGHGNNDADRADGVLHRNVVGTYLHGPLLAKNPEVADHLIQCALNRRAAKLGKPAPSLPPLDDSAELAANAAMCHRLGVHS